MDLRVDLSPKRPGALVLRNPVLAAGTVGYGREYLRQPAIGDTGSLGGLVTRTTTLQRRATAPTPRLAGTAAGVLLGRVPNPGLGVVLREHAPAWAGWPLPVILAVAGQSPGEYARIGVQIAGAAGVAGVEMDLSAPPVPGKPAAGWDPAEAWLAVDAMRSACTLPLLVRLPWSGPLLVEVAKAACLAGADALTLISPLPGMSIDVSRRRVALAGGLSGPALLPLVLRCLSEVSAALPDVPLVAAAGAASADDAVACLLAGATAVQVDSATLGDPRAALLVVTGLTDYCREKGITQIDELRGAALSGADR
jgi:dihydroorotate dehydrogenase (NAD+) catalytic subunit